MLNLKSHAALHSPPAANLLAGTIVFGGCATIELDEKIREIRPTPALELFQLSGSQPAFEPLNGVVVFKCFGVQEDGSRLGDFLVGGVFLDAH